MPRGDETKEIAFKLWRDGKSVPEIQREIEKVSETKPSSVRGWILDWERGSQRSWSATVKA
jgi:hypothetical protein